MPGKLARRTLNLVRKTRGSVGRLPRCTNVDRVPEQPIVGYVEVNKNATTPFSRGKVHKGMFTCPRADVENGDIILDRAEDSYYFVMDKKVEMSNGEDIYIDATMYRCDAVVDIQRFDQGIRDTFGRVVQAAPVTYLTNVRCMFNAQNFDIKEQQDRVIADNKIKMCIQSKAGVAVADRIIIKDPDTLEAVETYQVISVEHISLQNLDMCIVDVDVR